MAQAYNNITILDLTHVLAGPFCTYQFALLGADVIKIEDPNNPDCARGRGPDDAQNEALRGLNYQVQASNKRALTLDLRQEKGREVLKRLAEKADVLVENYRTGALGKLGLGYEDLISINPSLIYCSLTGYGDVGPRAKVNAYDNVIQATSGIIDQSKGHKPGVSFVDYAAGYNAAFAISSALFRRKETGEGTYISCSMLETAMTMMAPEVAAVQYPEKSDRHKEAGIIAYDTLDGILMLGAFTPEQNCRMWNLFPSLGIDFNTQFKETKNWSELWDFSAEMKNTLQRIMAGKSADDWQTIFHRENLPAEKQRSVIEAVEDPQFHKRGYFHRSEKGLGDTHAPLLPRAAYTLAKDGPAITSPPPAVGEHTLEILTELGFSESELNQLRDEAVI